MQLGTFGVWIGRTLGEELYGEAAALAQELGFGTLWLGGSPRLAKLRAMLEATDRIVIATGVVNVWQYQPAGLADEFNALEEAFPGRVLLGIGIGHPEATQEYSRPLASMGRFLDALAAAAVPVDPERMVLAALGPKMLDLSAARTLGAHPYFTPPAHTRFARERLGQGPLLAPEQAVVVSSGDRAAALQSARQYAGVYLGLSNYTASLERLGYSKQALAGGGSQEVVDEFVPQGSGDEVASAVRRHLEAGADHVCVQAVGAAGVPEREWRELAAALIA